MLADDQAPCLDERQAARFFSVSSEALRAWRRRGKGPRFYKIGGHLVRYSVADLVAWKESQQARRDTSGTAGASSSGPRRVFGKRAER